ncbi:hypothetical protein CAEBREN_03298 [Caenorhabditis brenneri]|uniref:Uncharacterized protein n=1 Tax=Caenorhabditis brenneri TaxID=135651 RepID=G0N6D1_CAEBE|nr:hypothetical protein CAEBREN_03298 [Caenorhabditis brenneri]
MHLWMWWWLLMGILTVPSYGFLWTLFGGVPGYIEPLPTTTDSSYRGPPASAPISEEQLDNERKYATNQVAYHSESRPVTLPDSAYGDQALSQLEDELAAEKYKYNLQKAAEEKQKKERQKQGRIRVFKIKPHKSAPKLNTGMVEWQSSQVAKCELLSNFNIIVRSL